MTERDVKGFFAGLAFTLAVINGYLAAVMVFVGLIVMVTVR